MLKKTPRKKRTEHIFGTTTGEVTELSVHVDEQTGEISFGNAMTNVYSQVSYERAKGPKIISRVPQAGVNLTFDVADALFKNYDLVCAADTNSRVINGRTVSVVAVATAQEAPPPPGATDYWKLELPFCWEFVGLKVEKPENFGWIAAIEELSSRSIIVPTERVGMIVDSDLGNLADYNQRKKPIFEDQFLPRNVQLIYASADTGGESVVNRILKAVDDAATQALDALSTGKIEFNSKKTTNPWYEGIRIIVPQIEGYDVRF